MLGKLCDSKEVYVIGAGISGLLAAYQLTKKGYRVYLQEGSNRTGGLICTRATDWGIVETAAHSLLATNRVKQLFADLNVAYVGVNPSSKAKYVLRNNRFQKYPLSVLETLNILKNIVLKKSEYSDTEFPTIQQWAENHLGKSACEYLISPFLTGVFGASPLELDLKASFPSWAVPKNKSLGTFLLEKRKQKSERPTMIAPLYGMQALIDGLTFFLKEKIGERFLLNTFCEEIPENANVVLCTSAHEASRLLKSKDSVLSSALEAISYTSLITSTVFIKKSAFSTKMAKQTRAVGVLIPPSENYKILGVLFNSSSFPNRSSDCHESFTVMLGGTRAPQLLNLPEQELKELVSEQVTRLFGLKDKPEAVFIHVWKKAIPLYNANIRNAWGAANKGWCAKPGRILFGNYTGSVSIRGMIEDSYSLVL